MREPQPSGWEARLTQVRDLAGALALLAVPVFALRAWVVASFDFSVASALMLHTTPAQLVYVSLLYMTPIFLVASGILVSRWLCRAAIQRGMSPALIILSSFGSVPILLIPVGAGFDRVDWFNAIPMLLTVPMLGVADITAEQLDPQFAKRAPLLRFLAISLAILTAAVFALYPRMWLPPERVTISGAAKKVYVLERKDDEYVLFDPRDRSVVRVPAEKVENRQYCDESPGRASVINMVVPRPKGRPTCS
ncbi:hypothetical protein LAH08_05703 [Micromonospora noduli]|uniref:Uncharacterized protein n=1 Tax=Micromonospora noduli TaxID=709876 RepID=A0A328MXJ5_9ACTN|nr:hypothetical protein LAH08_05703 [Micromonospora noduli]